MNLRAQVALETVAIFGFFLVLFIAASAYYYGETAQADEWETRIEAQRLARSLALAINAAAHTPGFRTTVELPQALPHLQVYTATAYPGYVAIAFGNRTVIEPLQAASIRNATAEAPLVLAATRYYVNESQGGVRIDPA